MTARPWIRPSRRSLIASRIASMGRPGGLAELLGQRDDDALGAADVAEPIAVLVLHHLANELRAADSQTGHDGVDIVDREHDPTHAQPVDRCVRLSADRRRRLELRQLDPAVAVRGSQHRDVASDTIEPDEAVHAWTLDCRLALQLQTKFDEEGDRSREVVDDDADVVHPFDHGGSPSSARGPAWPLLESRRKTSAILPDQRRRWAATRFGPARR